MIYTEKPKGFQSARGIVGCFVQGGYSQTSVPKRDILLLQRSRGVSYPLTWGLPAGKIDNGEQPHEAMSRELCEETGINAGFNNEAFLQTIFVRNDRGDSEFHMYKWTLGCSILRIQLSPREHVASAWVTPMHALTMDLMPDLGACIRLVYEI